MSSKIALNNTRGFVAARLETRVGATAVSQGKPLAVAFSRSIRT